MKRQLVLLNLVLAVAVAAAGLHLQSLVTEARKRHDIVLDHYPLPPAPTQPTPFQRVPPVGPDQYGEVIQRLVLAKDRNPIPEPPPPPPPPEEKKEKPMPSLPLVYGVFSFGEAPLVMLSPQKGGAQKGYRAGEKVGEFKILGFNNTQIQLEWEGKIVTRSLEELRDRSAPVVEQAVAAAAPAAAPRATTLIGEKEKTQVNSAGEPITTATQQGDTVKFVRPGPFGNYTWTKNKSELTDAERALVDKKN